MGNVSLRVGLNSGAVFSSMIGSTTPRWSLYGDCVNVASRMESTSQPGSVHISSATARLLMMEAPLLRAQVQRRPGYLNVKGKGPMQTWWLRHEPGVVVRSSSWSPEDKSVDGLHRSNSWKGDREKPGSIRRLSVQRSRSHELPLASPL